MQVVGVGRCQEDRIIERRQMSSLSAGPAVLHVLSIHLPCCSPQETGQHVIRLSLSEKNMIMPHAP